MKVIKYSTIFIFIFTLLLSCGVSRKQRIANNTNAMSALESQQDTGMYKIPDSEAKKANASSKGVEILDKIRNNTPDFNTLSIKFDADYLDTKTEQSFSGQIRIIRDSCIWISASKLGLEIARALFTKDSVFFVSRLSSDYGCFDYDVVKSFAGIEVDFEMLQAIFTARELLSFNKNCQYREPSTLVFYDRGNSDISIPEQQIGYDLQTYKITSNILRDPKGRSFTVQYSNWETDSFVPQLLQILVQKPDKLILNLTYKQAVVNIPVDMPFKLPKSGSKWTPKF